MARNIEKVKITEIHLLISQTAQVKMGFQR